MTKGSKKYKEMKSAASEFNERGDCTVVATAIACGIPYREAHAMMKAAGRKDRDGFAFWNGGIEALRKAGYKVEFMAEDGSFTDKWTLCPRQKRKRYHYDYFGNPVVEERKGYYTPKSIHKLLKEGAYICGTRGHVLAVVDGQVHDWSISTKKHIYKIARITKA